MEAIANVAIAVIDMAFPGWGKLLDEIQKLCLEAIHEKEECLQVLDLVKKHLAKNYDVILKDYKDILVEATKKRRKRDRVLSMLKGRTKRRDFAEIRRRINEQSEYSIMHIVGKVEEIASALTPTPTDSSSSSYPDDCELLYIATEKNDDREPPVDGQDVKLRRQQALNSVNDEQTAAVDKLRDLASKNRENLDLMAKLDVIPVLSDLLMANSTDLRQSAACALGNLAFGNKRNSGLIADAQTIGSLVQLLEGIDSEPAYAAYALGHLADHNPSIHEMITKKPTAIPQLIKLVRDGGPVQRAYAAFALAGISLKNEDVWRVAEEQCITTVLYDLLKEGSAIEKGYAVYALGCLASDKAFNAEKILRLGAIPVLVDLAVEPSLQRQYAVFALGWLANRPDARNEIVAHEAIPSLIDILCKSHHPLEKQHAAYALGILAHSKEFRQKIADCHAIQALIPLLRRNSSSEAPRLKQHAACALGWILSAESTRQGLTPDELYQLMQNLITLINENKEEKNEECSKEPETAAYALAQLTQSEEARALPLMKKSVVDLVPLLTQPESADYAAQALFWLAHAKPISILIGSSTDGISSLIRLLDDKAPTQHRLHAAKTLGQLAQDAWNRSTIVASNGIEPLSQILQSSSTPVALPMVNSAVRALAELALDEEGKKKIVSNQGIEALVALLAPNLSSDTPLNGSAAFALGRLAFDKDIGTKIAERGAIKKLITLVTLKDQNQSGYAVFALSWLAKSKPNRMVIAEHDGVRPLIGFFQAACKSDDSQHKRDATHALALLAQESVNRNEIGASKNIRELVTLLEDKDCRKQAAWVLASLTHVKQLRTEIGDSNGVDALIRLLENTNGEQKRKPLIESLRWLALDDGNRMKMKSVRSIIGLPSEHKIQGILQWRHKPEFSNTDWDLKCETEYKNNPWRLFGTEFKPKA